MNENKILKALYTFFLGLLLAIFVGVGVNTFYPAPKAPEYPRSLAPSTKEPTQPTPDQIAEQQAYDKQAEEHAEKSRSYNRDVSIITLIAAVAFLVISLMSEKRMRVIADGIMLGGLFTLLYSLTRSLASEDNKYTFATVSVGLVVVLYIGYRRFLKATPPQKKTKRSKA